MTSQFSDMTSLSTFFDALLFLLLSWVTGPNFISISSLVLELWQFTLTRDWPEIPKSEISLSEFCTAFTVFDLLRENQQGVPPPSQIRVNGGYCCFSVIQVTTVWIFYVNKTEFCEGFRLCNKKLPLLTYFYLIIILNLKSNSHIRKNCVICLIESSLKMRKNVFLFRL